MLFYLLSGLIEFYQLNFNNFDKVIKLIKIKKD